MEITAWRWDVQSTVQNNTASANGSTGISVGNLSAVIANTAHFNGAADLVTGPSSTRALQLPEACSFDDLTTEVTESTEENTDLSLCALCALW